MNKKNNSPKEDKKISKDMTFQEILDICPDAAVVMAKYEMGCLGCMMASFETLEQGCQAHDVDTDKLVAEINELIKNPKEDPVVSKKEKK